MRCPRSERWRALLGEPVADNRAGEHPLPVENDFEIPARVRDFLALGRAHHDEAATATAKVILGVGRGLWRWSKSLLHQAKLGPVAAKFLLRRMEDKIEDAFVLGSCHGVILASQTMRDARSCMP